MDAEVDARSRDARDEDVTLLPRRDIHTAPDARATIPKLNSTPSGPRMPAGTSRVRVLISTTLGSRDGRMNVI